MTKMAIYAHNMGSNGATELAAALNIKKIKLENSKFKGSKDKVIINWGAAKIDNPEVLKCKILNDPKAVALCTNKLRFFDTVAKSGGVNLPDFTTDSAVAFKWVADGSIVVARTVLNGSGGAGIVLMNKDDPKTLVKAGLYTKYIPKKDEFRAHVIKGAVVDVQKKALRNGWTEEHGGEVNYKIRNLANGFIYMRQGVAIPRGVEEQAIAAIRAVGLDFGAVDIIYNEKQSKAYVLEVNTAPGLEGQTVENYARGLR